MSRAVARNNTIPELLSPKPQTNITILHSGSKAQDKGDSRNHSLQDPHVSTPDYTIIYNAIQ